MPNLLTHLSLLEGSATREAAPGLDRGQKVCPGSFSSNVVLSGVLFSANVVPKPRMLSGQRIYVLRPLQLERLLIKKRVGSTARSVSQGGRLRFSAFGSSVSLFVASDLGQILPRSKFRNARNQGIGDGFVERKDQISSAQLVLNQRRCLSSAQCHASRARNA